MKIIDLKDDLPIEWHETMSIYDPSKIQAFMDCPRGFFFGYVLGWQKEEPNNHLVFGSAWHDAMEELLLEGYTDEAVMSAYDKFMATYREGFPLEHEDTARAPKNPEYALKALVMYVNMWKGQDKFETLYTEVSGAVPVSDERVIHVKLDSILRELTHNRIISREHKTTGRNSGSWRDKWSIMLQVDAYSHLLHSAFPGEQIGGVEINGAVFTKTKTAEFIRIPIHKSEAAMRHFLWEVNHWLEQIEWNFQQLAECSASDDIMHAFPKNCMSCSKFGCKFPGICGVWQNPLQEQHQVPSGYRKEFWDPRRVDLNKIKATVEPDEAGKVTIKPKHTEDE